MSRILVMEPKAPITLDDAIVRMTQYEAAARAAGRKGAERGHLFWYAYHFVEWLSEIGYHVELTGDEFDSYTVTDKII